LEVGQGRFDQTERQSAPRPPEPRGGHLNSRVDRHGELLLRGRRLATLQQPFPEEPVGRFSAVGATAAERAGIADGLVNASQIVQNDQPFHGREGDQVGRG
jgi:hypothetical protein